MDAAEKSFGLIPWIVVLLVLGAIVLPQMIRILREYERGVIFRLGKLIGAKGPGLILLIPIVDRMVKIDPRVVTIEVPKQEVMTRDNVPATVDAVIYFRVVDPQAAVVKVENFLKASSLIAQTTLRSVLASRSSTSCWPSATRSTSNFRKSLTNTPSLGASKSPPSKFATWSSPIQ